MEKNGLDGSSCGLRSCHLSGELELEKKPGKGQRAWIPEGGRTRCAEEASEVGRG